MNYEISRKKMFGNINDYENQRIKVTNITRKNII